MNRSGLAHKNLVDIFFEKSSNLFLIQNAEEKKAYSTDFIAITASESVCFCRFSGPQKTSESSF
jgi:hypothetical protein